MTIYEIDQAIQGLVDPETGELGDLDAFHALHMARNKKIENLALLYKETAATAAAMKEEITKLTERKRVLEGNMARMKQYLQLVLEGEKFSTPRCAVSYRWSQTTETAPEFRDWARENRPDLLIEQEPKIDVLALKKELASGLECDYARIVRKQSVQIK